MKATIDVENKREGDLIRQALADPETRAYVNVIGALLTLQPRARTRVMAMTNDKLAEMAESEKK